MTPVIVWFRRNLRLIDNAALIAAAETGQAIIPVYIIDEQDTATASRWWLHQSLCSLSESLGEQGGDLLIRAGDPCKVLSEIAAKTSATAVFYSRRYEAVSRQQEDDLSASLDDNLEIHAYDDGLLHPPNSIQTQTGTRYKVFTPFWRAATAIGDPPSPRPMPTAMKFTSEGLATPAVTTFGLTDLAKDRGLALENSWTPGEAAALDHLDELAPIVNGYHLGRDRPDLEETTQLSPYLHFGELSVRQVFAAVYGFGQESLTDGAAALLRQLYWRDFSSYLLYHFPELPVRPLRPEFEKFSWSESDADLSAWQRGETGYPIVDAGMRQLLATGWMHNRVRMIVASFLTKDLLIPWQAGAAWFLDNLVDADLANNSASWQWVAGCGTDAAPFFRIFNPTTQGQKFDPHGHYVRKWVPELQMLTGKEVHEPWKTLPEHMKAQYAAPMVDHAAARQRALEAYRSVKGTRTSKLAP
jgi:deoxyribodipyrimidine photo-lyase